jgi:DNA-binding MarR family transcriptional regulator
MSPRKPQPDRPCTGNVADECIASRARRISRAVSNLYDEALRPHALRASQMGVLVALDNLGPSQPSDLCTTLVVDKSTLSRNVDRMIKNGWILSKDGKDDRSTELHLTPKGRTLLTAAVPSWRKAQKKARALLGERDADAIVRIGNKLGGTS